MRRYKYYKFVKGNRADKSMAISKGTHKNRKCRLEIEHGKPVTRIEAGTLIIYLGSGDKEITKEIRMLDKRFRIIPEYRNSTKNIGEISKVYKENYSYGLYCCNVRNTMKDHFDFMAFGKCIRQIKKENDKNKDEKYYYVAMQYTYDDKDDLLMSKIINLLCNIFFDVDVYICKGLE